MRPRGMGWHALTIYVILYSGALGVKNYQDVISSRGDGSIGAYIRAIYGFDDIVFDAEAQTRAKTNVHIPKLFMESTTPGVPCYCENSPPPPTSLFLFCHSYWEHYHHAPRGLSLCWQHHPLSANSGGLRRSLVFKGRFSVISRDPVAAVGEVHGKIALEIQGKSEKAAIGLSCFWILGIAIVTVLQVQRRIDRSISWATQELSYNF